MSSRKGGDEDVFGEVAISQMVAGGSHEKKGNGNAGIIDVGIQYSSLWETD